MQMTIQKMIAKEQRSNYKCSNVVIFFV